MEKIESVRKREKRSESYTRKDYSALSSDSVSTSALTRKLAKHNPLGLTLQECEIKRDSWIIVFTACVEVDAELSKMDCCMSNYVGFNTTLKMKAMKELENLNLVITLLQVPEQIDIPF